MKTYNNVHNICMSVVTIQFEHALSALLTLSCDIDISPIVFLHYLRTLTPVLWPHGIVSLFN